MRASRLLPCLVAACFGVDWCSAFVSPHFSPSRKNIEYAIGSRQDSDTDFATDKTRHWLLRYFATAVAFGSTQSASAAPPMTVTEAESAQARALRLLRPKPQKLIRPKVQQDFAVLLMRSSYNALDELDCVPMDQFQRDFFIIRQAEYLPYTELVGAGMVKQGELSDPYYFDFISFAQYSTINREITKDPQQFFQEMIPVSVNEDEQQVFEKKIIRRDPSISDKMLPTLHSKTVGAAIIDRLVQVMGDTAAAIPMYGQSKPNADQVQKGLDQLVKLFVINGFAWDGSVKRGSGSNDFVIFLDSPATLWSGQALQTQRVAVTNDFMLKAATELIQRYGYDVRQSKVKYTGSTEQTSLSIV